MTADSRAEREAAWGKYRERWGHPTEEDERGFRAGWEAAQAAAPSNVEPTDIWREFQTDVDWHYRTESERDLADTARAAGRAELEGALRELQGDVERRPGREAKSFVLDWLARALLSEGDEVKP